MANKNTFVVKWIRENDNEVNSTTVQSVNIKQACKKVEKTNKDCIAVISACLLTGPFTRDKIVRTVKDHNELLSKQEE
jgi:hypothetical protein